ALAGLSGVLLMIIVLPGIRARISRSRDPVRAPRDPCRAAFEQSTRGILIADAATLRVIDANPTEQQALGFSLQELRKLHLSQILVDEQESTEALLRKLRDPHPRTEFRIAQRCKNGSLLDVDIRGQRLELSTGHVLVLTTEDITVRRKVEAQLLEKQQH